jgi:hypothetical protein
MSPVVFSTGMADMRTGILIGLRGAGDKGVPVWREHPIRIVVHWLEVSPLRGGCVFA